MLDLKRAALVALMCASGAATGAGNLFCGGPVPQTGEPTDLAHVVGDQTLEYLADQPASLLVCSKGYLFEKCGDHATAMKIFDRCIAAGYIGAMIWKALMLQDGAEVPRDLAGAAELMRRAAESGDSPYAVLGKLHYASALHEGKGVPKDEAAARRWFEAAAADGNPDAIEFLRTGYHVGDRDGSTRGVGVPPPVQAAPLPGELQEQATRPVERIGPAAPLARRLSQTPVSHPAASPQLPPHPVAPADASPAPQPVPPAGLRLEPVAPPAVPAPSQPAAGLLAVLLAAFAAGALGQALRGRRAIPSPVLSGA
jgi:hypothetical protein